MAKPTRIHAQRPAVRRHFFKEWLAERRTAPMDFVRMINEGADMDRPEIDKSQIYKWLRGEQAPQDRNLLRIAEALDLRDPASGEVNPYLLFVHPTQVWITRKLQGQTEEDIARVRQLVEIALPERKTGTDN